MPTETKVKLSELADKLKQALDRLKERPAPEDRQDFWLDRYDL